MSTWLTKPNLRMMLAELLLERNCREDLEAWFEGEGVSRKTLHAVARGLGVDVEKPVWRVPANVVPIRRLLAA
jgi:hypothetical protein